MKNLLAWMFPPKEPPAFRYKWLACPNPDAILVIEGHGVQRHMLEAAISNPNPCHNHLVLISDDIEKISFRKRDELLEQLHSKGPR